MWIFVIKLRQGFKIPLLFLLLQLYTQHQNQQKKDPGRKSSKNVQTIGFWIYFMLDVYYIIKMIENHSVPPT